MNNFTINSNSLTNVGWFLKAKILFEKLPTRLPKIELIPISCLSAHKSRKLLLSLICWWSSLTAPLKLKLSILFLLHEKFTSPLEARSNCPILMSISIEFLLIFLFDLNLVETWSRGSEKKENRFIYDIK